jgi:hypothetical protein
MNACGSGGSGGAGGGGAGGGAPLGCIPNSTQGGANASDNTGGGGGGTKVNAGGKAGTGGSGIVVVRVPSDFTLSGTPSPAFTGSTHPGGDKIGKFTASGTLTIGGT